MEVDIVIPWVDGGDPAWQAERQRHQPENVIMNGSDKFRDWNNLQYLFRGIETFTPWVRKVFFVTWGHTPKWLNQSHPKLKVVNHRDYLQAANLPVFSSHPIEINMHRIEGLAEKFIYFNDDCFLLQPMGPERFFRDGLPVDAAIANVMNDGTIAPIVLNCIDLINKNFNRHKGQKLTKNQIIRKHFGKWFSPKYGMKSLDTLLLMNWRVFTGFVDFHQPQPFLKSTFDTVWEKEPEALARTSASKFRSNMDVNQYLFRYWQLVTGKFYPDTFGNAFKRRKRVELRTVGDVKQAAADLNSGRFDLYCLNDAMSKGRFTAKNATEEELDASCQLLTESFEQILPNKSAFEL